MQRTQPTPIPNCIAGCSVSDGRARRERNRNEGDTQSEPNLQHENEALLVSAASCLSEEQELRRAVCGLQAKVMTLQEHLTQLTLELLRERSEGYEHRLSALEALLPQSTRMGL